MSKSSIVSSVLSFVVGILLSFVVIYLWGPKRSISVFGEPLEIKELERKNEVLESEIQRLREAIVFEGDTHIEKPSDAEKKRFVNGFINEIVRGDFEPKMVTRGQRQMLQKLASRLMLTPDQLIQAELMWEKNKINNRLWGLRDLGIIDDSEYEKQVKLLGISDLEASFKGILTEEQVVLFEEKKAIDRREGASNMASFAIVNYQLNDPKLYTAEESNLIRDALTDGYGQNSKLNMPESIRALDIEKREKIILTHLYHNTNPDLFEKAYASIVEGKD
jgi:hypothetical protein